LAEGSESQSGEKTEEPSSYRLEEFRKRGEVASSKELTSAIVLAGCFVVLSLSILYLFEIFSEFLIYIINLDFSMSFQNEMIKDALKKSITLAAKAFAPIGISSILIGVLTTVSQIGILYAPDVLTLKLDRINPINGFQRLFTMRSIVEAAKGFLKFLFIVVIAYTVLKDDFESFSGFIHLDALNSFLYAKDLIIKLAMYIIGGLFIVSLFDLGYQKYSYHQKLKLTKEEAKKEAKEKDGNPEVKQRIRNIQREMANKRMMADIPKADVIVTNPTHISIALRYSPEKMMSPEVIGKGADHLAIKIREIAKENNIPLVENVPLARTLYKTVRVNEAVPRSLYKAVAEVLAFVYRIKNKKSQVG
jgi:flagellar biosynthesis protein FlhB